MLTIHPPLEEQDDFATPLEPGQARLRDRLAEYLEGHPDEWHLWVEPYTLDLRPDLLVGSRAHGVCVIEVKDWSPRTLEASNGYLYVNGERTRADPLAQTHRYRSLLSDRLIARPGENVFAGVGATLAAPRMPTATAEQIFRTGTRLTKTDGDYIHIAGSEIFDDDEALHELLTARRRTKPLSGRTFDRLVARLREPVGAWDQRRDLHLSPGAENIAKNPSKATTRRVRGCAGSGKTLGLAARAAHLAAANQRVLVLTFNITLAHHVQDLVRRRARALRADPRLVDCTHIHGFCRSIVPETGFDHPNELIALARAAYAGPSRGSLPRYEAILIDEGQDFEVEWWQFLRECVRRDASSEMILCFDDAQMLYGRRGWDDGARMERCGFRRWTELSGCYRMPSDMIPVVRDYASRYLSLQDDNLPSLPETGQLRLLSPKPTARRWVNCERDDVSGLIRQAVATLVDVDHVPRSEVTVLADHAPGQLAMLDLERAGEYVEHIFAEGDEEEQRRRKNSFWPGTPAIKGCTIHSFKGWESHGLVIVVEHPSVRDDAPSPEILLYVALTRVRGEPDLDHPASVFVINTVRRLDAFARDFNVDTLPIAEAWPLRHPDDAVTAAEGEPAYEALRLVPPPEAS